MTLIEALKTGKRAKNAHGGFINPSEEPLMSDRYNFTRADLLTNTWEVEPDAKPRMLAWYHMENGRLDFTTGEHPKYTTGWTRCPWLDEPEEK